MTDETRTAHRWAWLGVVFGAGLSIAGNGWHVALTESSMGMALRLVWACIWPVLLLIGIEVLARVDWRGKWLDRLAQFMLTVPVAAVAAVVSYRHQSALILLADPSDEFSAAIGPLAIDGLMLGCTIALLVIRSLTTVGAPAPAPTPVSSEQPVSAPAPEAAPVSPAPALPGALTDDDIWRGIEQATAPMSAPAPITRDGWAEQALTEAREQRSRERGERSSEALTLAVKELLSGNGVPVGVVASAHEVGVSTLRKYASVIRYLRERGSEHPITVKVSAPLLALIREHVRSEQSERLARGGERPHDGDEETIL
jgi:hypothetical protein